MADMPVCENYQRNQCPKSDVRLMAEHGTTQYLWYTSFFCRTCRLLFMVWNPRVIEAAKQQRLDRTIGSLMGDRFKGLAQV